MICGFLNDRFFPIVHVIFSAQSADYHNSVSFSNTLDLNKKRMSDRNGPIYFVCFLLGLKQFCHKNIYVFIKYLKCDATFRKGTKRSSNGNN